MLGLSKQQRLHHAADFRNIFRNGKKLSGRYYALYVYPNQLSSPRLGIVIAKKVERTAVGRNQFKRIVRESFRQNQPNLLGIDVLVVAFIGASKLNKADLRGCLDLEWPKLVKFL